MEDPQHYLEQGLLQAREASRQLAQSNDATVRQVLNALADRALEACDEILEANRSDLSRMPEDDPKQRKPDISLARKKINWEPIISLDEGLGETIAYFKDLLETI